jgi:hypothetical protein
MMQESSVSADSNLSRAQLTALSQLLSDKYKHETAGPEDRDERVVPDYAFDLEAIVHELCHLAVFNMDPRGHERRLAKVVGEVFLGYVNPLASDDSECRALAVQLLVVKHIGLRIHMHRLCRDAAQEMRSETYQDDTLQVLHVVRRYRKHPRAQELAERVLSWLKPLINKVLHAETVRPAKRQDT